MEQLVDFWVKRFMNASIDRKGREMPGILVEVDGARVATIDLSAMQVVDVSVHGGLDGENKATLDAYGGNYADGACGHLIYIEERVLLPGQLVCVTFQAHCDNPDRGQTLDELYPGEEAIPRTDFSINEERAAELRARPRLHEEFIAQVDTASGERMTAVSDEFNTSFRFGLLWDWLHPDRARMSLTTYCLEDVLARRPGTKHVESMLDLGQSVVFSLVR